MSFFQGVNFFACAPAKFIGCVPLLMETNGVTRFLLDLMGVLNDYCY